MTLKQATSTIQIDNETVRVTKWDFAPGSETGMHVHELNYVVVPVTGGILTIEAPDGSQFEAKLVNGKSYTRDVGTEHNVINNSDSFISFVEVEIK